MIEKLITVVLPVYNVDKYLDRCMECVVNQTYKNLEILLIDDGSMDSSPRLCDDWASKDSRIKVIHKKNEGLGITRNRGIENAKGEYICFIDSDDYIALDLIEKAYRKAVDAEAEIVVWGITIVNQLDSVIKIERPCVNPSVYEGTDVQERFLPYAMGMREKKTDKQKNYPMSACCRLYSMQLIHRVGWRMESEREIISEDLYSLLKLHKDVKRIAILPEAGYFYCQNQNSLTHVYRKDRYERIKDFYNKSIALCEELNYGDDIKTCLGVSYISYTIAAMKMILASSMKKSDKIEEIKKIVLDNTLHYILGTNVDIGLSGNQKIFANLMRRKCYHLIVFLLWLKNSQS